MLEKLYQFKTNVKVVIQGIRDIEKYMIETFASYEKIVEKIKQAEVQKMIEGQGITRKEQ